MTDAIPGAPRRGRRRSRFVAAVLLGSLTLAGSASAGPLRTAVSADEPVVTWGLQPTQNPDGPYRPNFVFTLKPGEEIHDSIHLQNYSAEKVELTIYPSDAFNSPNGALDLLPGDKEPTDVGRWITLDETNVTLSPNDLVDIPFTLTVPKDGVEGGDHVGGIVSSFKGVTNGEKAPVKLDRRLGTRVQVRIDGPLNPQLTISKMKTRYDGPSNPAATGTMRVTYTVTNTGNVRLAAKKSIKVKSPIGFPTHTTDLAPLPELLPGNAINIADEIHGVWPTVRASTKVTLTATPTRDGDDFNGTEAGASASTGAWTWPWAFLLLMVALGIGYAIRRELKKRREAAHARELEALVDARIGQPVGGGGLGYGEADDAEKGSTP